MKRKQKNKLPAKEMKRRRLMKAKATEKTLGRKLKKLYGRQIRYYFLAGDNYRTIVEELDIAKKHCKDNQEWAIAGVKKAIYGDQTQYFGRSYDGLVNKRDRETISSEMRVESSRKNHMLDLSTCLDIHDNPEDQLLVAAEDPARDVDRLLLDETMQKVLHTLTYREREVIKMRFGIGHDSTYTLEETGKNFGRSPERARQIEGKAIRKLQHPVRSRKLEGFIDERREKPTVIQMPYREYDEPSERYERII